MRKTVFVMLAMALVPFGAFAADGVELINQSTVMATGGFPYVINVPGSYKLSGILDVRNTLDPANTTAIRVIVDNVTIDLNGFSILGPTVCTGFPTVTSCSPTGSGRGIDGPLGLSLRNITVVNGTVRGMGSAGILLDAVIGVSVEKVHTEFNGAIGISVGFGMVVGSTANYNGVRGIQVSKGTVSGNVALGNQGIGILAGCPGSVVGNTAANNSGQNLLITDASCAAANNSAP